MQHFAVLARAFKLEAGDDATLKVWVEGYTAFSKGRFIGDTGKYTIWAEGADRYWGNNNNLK